MSEPTASAIGVDIGGTRLKSVLIDAHGAVLAEDERDSTEGADAFVDLVQTTLGTLGAETCLPLGIACPGLAQRDHRAIASMPGRLEGLAGIDFGKALDRPTYVLNDAHAATIGEATLGAAKSHRNVIMLTLGTGVGGGVIIDGKLYTGATGRAGHFGHITVNAKGPQDICNMPGSIEDAIGNHTIRQRSDGRFPSTHELIKAVKAGDNDAKHLWLESIDCLAAAIGSLINVFDPEVVVIGGGIAMAGPELFDPLTQAMNRTEWRPLGEAVPIIPATLGAQAGALGAAFFAMELAMELNPS